MAHWHTPVSRRSETDENSASLQATVAGLLFAATLLARTAGVPYVTLQRRNADGTVQQARVSGDLRQVHVWQENEPEDKRPEQIPAGQAEGRLAWLPEGFLLTPRSADAPEGLGLPIKPDGSYTAGGAIPQVLLNRKFGNQYPAALNAAIDRRPRKRRVIEAAPLFYMPWERLELKAHGMQRGIGCKNTKGAWQAQFDEKGLPRWKEADGGQWFCHRPKVAAETSFQFEARKLVNQIRAAAGRDKLGPPLLGWAGMMGPVALYAMKASKVHGHDSRKFPQGYESYTWRLQRRLALYGHGGENVLFGRVYAKDKKRAQEYVAAWRNSPPHYANMIDDWAGAYRLSKAYAWVEHAWVGDFTMNETQLPPYGLDAPVRAVRPPQTGAGAEQHFHAAPLWMMPGAVGRPMDSDNRVGLSNHWFSRGGFFLPLKHRMGEELESGGQRNRLYVTHRGRVIWVTKEEGDESCCEVIGAVIRRTALDGAVLRIAVLERAAYVSESDRPMAAVALYEGKLNDFLATRHRFGYFQLPERISVMSAVRFSASGQAIFSYCMPEPHMWTAGRNNLFPDEQFPDELERWEDFQPPESNDPTWPNSRRFWGGVMHFKRWRDSIFAWEDPIAPQSLKVNSVYKTIYSGGAETAQRFEESCRGSYALLADFGGWGGESVQFLHVDIEATIRQEAARDLSANMLDKKLKGTLRFADGRELVYQDLRVTYNAGAPEGVSGHVLHLGQLDVLRGGNTAYMRFEFSGSQFAKTEASYWICGRQVRADRRVLEQSLADLEAAGLYWRNPRRIMPNTTPWERMKRGYVLADYGGGIGQTVMSPLGAYVWQRGEIVHGEPPPTKSALVYGTEVMHPPYRSHAPRLAMPVLFSADVNGIGFWGHDQYIRHKDMVAPIFLRGDYDKDSISVMQVEFHENQWVASCHVDDLLMGTGNWWPDDECQFHASSLNLNELTGQRLLPDITPFGIV